LCFRILVELGRSPNKQQVLDSAEFKQLDEQSEGLARAFLTGTSAEYQTKPGFLVIWSKIADRDLASRISEEDVHDIEVRVRQILKSLDPQLIKVETHQDGSLRLAATFTL